MSSPPLSTLHLAPVPRLPRLGRPSSIISSSSRSSLRSESSGPPPFAYDRRTKSLELLKGLKFLATTPEDQEDQERSTGPEQKRPSRPLSGLGRLKSFKRPAAPLQSDWQVVELEPKATGGESDKRTTRSSSSSSSHATITPHPPPVKMAQDPSPKKKGFFRRLSLSTSSHKAQVTPNGTSHLVKSSRTVSGGARRDPMLAGPAYDTLPPGAAPSAYREVRQDGSKDPRKDTPPSQHLFPDHGPLPPAKSSSRPSVRQAPTPPVPIAPPHNARHTSPPPGSSNRYASPSHSAQTPPPRTTESPHTPRRTSERNPIHPALASPPKSPPQLAVGTSPYDVRSMGSTWKQSYSIPAGLNQVEANGQANGVPRGVSGPGKRSVSSPMTPPDGPSVSGLAEALPHLGTNNSGQTLPMSISNISGRFADAETPSTERPSTSLQTPSTSRSPLSPGSVSRKSALKSPPVSMRTPRHSDTSIQATSPFTPTQKNHSPTSHRNAPPPLPHTRTSYFPQAAQFDPNNPETPPVTRRTSSATPGGVMSEASAYAMAMSSRSQKSPIERESTSSAPPDPERQRKSSRPLPRPPGERSPASQPHTIHVIASSDDKRQRTASGRGMPKVKSDVASPPAVASQSAPVPNGYVAPSSPKQPGGSLEKTRPKVVIPESPPQNRRVSTKPYQFDFTHSPTLPPLVDPRQGGEASEDPIDRWAPAQSPSGPAPPPAKRTSVGPPVVAPPPGAEPSALSPQLNGSPSLEGNQLPPRRTSIFPQLGGLASTVGSVFSSPTSASPISPTARRTRTISGQSKATTHKHLLGRGGKPTLAFLLAHPTIQSAILPCLTINSLLSLTGCSDVVRKQLSGELVGRWVLTEWGLQVDREKGRSWPNLTVWEGFLESLLHDPATYSTYPPQWHGLLQHLSLSHTLIVLHLRNLPATAFPNAAALPFEDEGSVMMTQMPFSQSTGSLSATNLALPRSRAPSRAGSENGSITPGSRAGGPPPKSQERLVEIVMPEPLAAKPQEEMKDFEPPTPSKNKLSRKGSRTSIISTSSFGLGRRRANSVSAKGPVSPTSASTLAAPMPGNRELPPVSFPSAKRYSFTRHGDPPSNRTRTMSGSMSSRPGSIFSVASSPSGSYHQRMSIGPASQRASFAVDRSAPPVPSYTSPRSASGLSVPNGPSMTSHRSSFASSDGRSRVSEFGGYSPQNPRFASPFLNRGEFTPTPPPRIEQAFERPPPYNVGRAPVLRVFVPLSEKVRKWPSAEGAAASVKELDKCGATRRLKLGDFVVNTALRHPKHTEHVLVFVPYIKHLLVPLEYKYSPTGHLPSYLDAFSLPPSYYYPFLPSPQIIFLNLAPYCIMAMGAIRLAFDRRDVTTASGARISAKRYLHVTGFQVSQGDPVAPEWQGMVSLESEGTAEGKIELERRLGGGDPNRAVMGPWEVIREKSMMGTIWLKLVKPEESPKSPTSPR